MIASQALAVPVLDLHPRPELSRGGPASTGSVRPHDPGPGPGPGDARVNHEYGRGGAPAYLAACDVHQAEVFGRCEPRTGIAPFTNLVTQVMTTEPYAGAKRVFWIFTDLIQVRDRLRAFEDRYNATAQPFRWKFTTCDLDDPLARPGDPSRLPAPARGRQLSNSPSKAAARPTSALSARPRSKARW